MDKLYTLRQVFELLGVSYQTVWNWVKGGKLPVVRLPNGRPRVRAEDIEKLLSQPA